ncbi:hypothetical protein [Micromonospora sp. WMMD1082]|uniref:hypothetical protein n=1 Tax=Micromonospora sp. WMMD1082 TaxID=3016104 RepID=UPI002415B7D8|nr:hypothetical protein [Micromonospora sp. WMMD1082]MDG4796223.1 hypothetical protein [Micromonospora sp. WMMD1082]
MSVIGDNAISRGDVMRRLRELEKQVEQLTAGRRLEAASIGRGGITIKDGGGIRVVDADGGQSIELSDLGLRIRDAAGNVVAEYGVAQTDAVRTLESSSETTYVDLATVGPRVTARVGSSGRLLLTASASINYVGQPGDVEGGGMSVEVTGATAVAAGSAWSAYDIGSAGIAGAVYTRIGTIHATTLLTNLNPGEHVITMKYASYTGNEVGWMERVLVALPV